jgi:hypothetical protein
MSPLSKKTQQLLLIFLVASSLTLAALIVTDWIPFLRGPAPETSEWYWPYLLRPLSRWWPSILVAGALWLLAAWWLIPEKTSRQRNLLALFGLILTSLLLQITIIYADRTAVTAELVDRTLSNLASGFFEPAAEIENMAAVLRNYPKDMPAFASEHAQTHPPGLIIANWFTIKAFARWPSFAEFIAQYVRPLRCTDLWLLDRPPEVAAALGIWSLLPLFTAAFIPLPAYGLARLLLLGRARRLAAILAATIPALLLFAPKSVQFYALLTLILFWIFQSAMVQGSLWRFFLAGTVVSLMTYLSFGNVVLFPLLLLYAILYQWLIISRQKDGPFQSITWIDLLKQMLVLAAAALSLWLVTWLLWSVPPWAIARVGLQQHYNLVTNLRRYDWWVIWNLIDLLLFAGWPLMVGFLGSIILVAHAWRRNKVTAVDILAVCLLFLIFLLNISGSARGEVGRIWLFFIPLLAFPAAHFWSASLPGNRYASTIVALQLFIVVCIGMSWRPVRAVIVEAQRPTITILSPDYDIDGSFIDQPFSLIGYSLNPDQPKAGEEIELTLFWQAEGPAQRPYTVFTHLTDETGNLVAQQDNWPVNGRWPPTCWHAGEQIIDTYLIRLPDSLPPGSYNLATGLYDSKTGIRIPLQDSGDAISLGTVIILPR